MIVWIAPSALGPQAVPSVPMPELGIDDAFVASLHIGLTGRWMEHPHTAVAGAVIYYSAISLYKAWGGPRISPQRIGFA